MNKQGWPTWCPEAVDALIMLDRLDVRDDQGRVDAIEKCIRKMADALKPSFQEDPIWKRLRDAEFACYLECGHDMKSVHGSMSGYRGYRCSKCGYSEEVK